MSSINDLVIQLATEILEAARNGQWDQAMALYDRRLSIEDSHGISRETRRNLLKCDQWLMGRVLGVRAAIQQTLGDIQEQRRKLKALKRQWAGTSHAPACHLLTV